jgi:hypothetical protein
MSTKEMIYAPSQYSHPHKTTTFAWLHRSYKFRVRHNHSEYFAETHILSKTELRMFKNPTWEYAPCELFISPVSMSKPWAGARISLCFDVNAPAALPPKESPSASISPKPVYSYIISFKHSNMHLRT